MAVLIAIFSISVVGMILLPVRHFSRTVKTISDEDVPVYTSILRAHVHSWFDRVERWYHEEGKNAFLRFIDKLLKFFERGAGQAAGQTKKLRLIVQERFRVIPRESLYWKNINSWKKTNGSSSLRSDHWEDDKDISNHLEK